MPEMPPNQSLDKICLQVMAASISFDGVGNPLSSTSTASPTTNDPPSMKRISNKLLK